MALAKVDQNVCTDVDIVLREFNKHLLVGWSVRFREWVSSDARLSVVGSWDLEDQVFLFSKKNKVYK